MTDRTTWRKSSYSGTQGNSSCVEVAGLSNGVGLRDSKNPTGGHLTVSPQSFAALVRKLKDR
jgi:Domain of unknown function (DUF397)